MSSNGRSEPLSLPGLPWPVELRVHPRARRLRLRLDENARRLVLTCPRRASRRAALDWVAGQSAWVERQVARVEPGEPLVCGGVIPFEDGELTIRHDPRGPRRPLIDGKVLRCGGPAEMVGKRVERFLRDRARDRLSLETRAIAEIAGVTVRSVAVGDAVSRWGSCSASGAIRYNWRLILAPESVLRWVVAHEVAHRVHMDHGAAFHALEARLYGGDVAAARAELRRLGPRLKRIGRAI